MTISSMERAGIILAAGQGTRMKSALPKVMHRVAGLPLLGHVIAAMKGTGIGRVVVVTAPQMGDVRAFAEAQGAQCAVQQEQLGTGHAAACAAPLLQDFSGALIVSYGDMPLVTAKTFADSFAPREGVGMAVVAFTSDNPSYGRVIMDEGLLFRIVEARDADEHQKKVKLCNAGIMAADARSFFRWTAMLKNENSQREYYLTDIPTLAREEGVGCAVVEADEREMMGVNSRAELAACETVMQQRLRARALEAGVGMIAPETVFFSHDTMLDADTQLGPYIVFGPGVIVHSGAQIREFSHLEGAEVGSGAIVGPFARLRPGTVLEDNVHIGNFVEVKKSRVEKGAKANHLTYLGDAHVGAGANIGAGTITCNYDGFDKYPTEIGAGAFIGSDTALVAPVKIGDGAITGAGSVIIKDVASGALGVARGDQREIAGWADKFRTRKKAEKAEKDSE